MRWRQQGWTNIICFNQIIEKENARELKISIVQVLSKPHEEFEHLQSVHNIVFQFAVNRFG